MYLQIYQIYIFYKKKKKKTIIMEWEIKPHACHAVFPSHDDGN